MWICWVNIDFYTSLLFLLLISIQTTRIYHIKPKNSARFLGISSFWMTSFQAQKVIIIIIGRKNLKIVLLSSSYFTVMIVHFSNTCADYITQGFSLKHVSSLTDKSVFRWEFAPFKMPLVVRKTAVIKYKKNCIHRQAEVGKCSQRLF